MGLYHVVILVLWCTSVDTSYLSKTDQPPSKTDYMKAFNQTIHAIERLLSFYEDQIHEVNLDAIYGLRVAEGALAFSLSHHRESFWSASETKHIYQKVRELHQQAASINNRAQTSIKKQSHEYYHKFKDVVDKPWSFFKDFGHRKLPMDKVEVVNYKVTSKNKTWDEATSDKCMSEALGSNPNHTKCMFSPLCVKEITDEQQVGYGPTHQLLFLTLALIHGCEEKYSDVLKQYSGYDVEKLVENRCVRIMSEMMGLENPNVKEYSRDLYMEQAFVCALHGYEEFVNLKRLKDILSWQRMVGCFGKLDDEGESEDNEEQTGTFGDEEQTGILGDNMGVRSRRNVGSFRSMRRLLVDVAVAHGCSAHESGVAAGLLGCYTRWLLTKLDTETEKLRIVPKVENPTNKSTNGEVTVGKVDKTTNKHNPTTGNNNIHKNNNITAKDIYIRSMIISLVTSLLTVAVVLSLYKLGENCCTGRRSKGKYRPLVDA